MKTFAAVTASSALALSVLVGMAPAQALPLPARAPVAANVCTDTSLPAALQGSAPGDLLAAPQDVTAQSGIATGRLFRVLYATTGEAGSVIASCGLIAVPSTGQVRGVIAWAHGTIGLMQSCQPSSDPAAFVGPMPSGIGVPVKGMSQQSGPLYSMLRSGYAVVATDYPSAATKSDPLQRYVLGVLAATAVLDSARALTNNEAQFGVAPIAKGAELPLITWGHSQGGGSALWAGQLARDYLAAQKDRTLDLAGVVGMAPATQFTTSPGQPASWNGKHLGDRDMYNMRPGLGLPFPIGTVLFSYVTASWSQVTNATAGTFPVGPTPSISYADVLSPDGQATAPKIAVKCLDKTGLPAIADAAVKYLRPSTTRFFAAPFAGTRGPLGWRGGIDATCTDPSSYPQGVRDWCAWLQFNMPGPYGVNPYSKVPRANDGSKVPVLISQGRNDRIMWCVDDTGIVTGDSCLSAQYYTSMLPQYCLGRGYLRAQYFADISHMDVPAATAYSPSRAAYTGSPLDMFVSGAMAGSLKRSCGVTNSPDPLPN